ncbi:unnamed protein product [Alopecurus aequalis]
MRSFEWWLGDIDLNQDPEPDEHDVTNLQYSRDGTSAGPSFVHDSSHARDSRDFARKTSASTDGSHRTEAGTVAGPPGGHTAAGQPSGSGPTVGTGVPSGVTLTSADSGSNGEVQSTPEGYKPQKPFLGKSTKDGEKDKAVFVYNKSGKNTESEATHVKQRMRTMIKLTDCKAKMRKYLRSHRIPKEEKKFIDLLHEVNLSSGKIMGELHGGKKNVPYDTKTVINYTTKPGEEKRFKDMPLLKSHFEELQKEDPGFFFKFKIDEDGVVENIFWVDSSAREMYKIYNDCISFDTTYMTNM